MKLYHIRSSQSITNNKSIMNIFEISGYAAIGLILTAALIPGLTVPALFFSVPCLCLWLLGECALEEEPNEKVTIKK